MQSSRGRWIVFGEDDVLMPVDYAETLVRVAEEQDAAIVGSPWLLVRDGDVEGAVAQARANAVEMPGLDTPSNFPVRTVESPFFPALALVRRDVFGEIQFDRSYGGNSFREETDFFVSAARAGFKVVMTPDTYSYQLNTWGGGAHSMRLGYELWSIRNTTRFVRRHGRWLRTNGHIKHPWLLTVRYAGSRLTHVAEYYARSAGGAVKRLLRR
jgi:GT2 family glycosyltransferase